ncbi:hypothetical protein GCM10011519_27980 [Marmoricola endophyticus]|uniref:Fluoride-specific ion channel FluC n=1 Tax=Marmoricola endophyticus TaxID=2040280 RepID=A0A917BPI8_9ACTN|nr:CrcB family protein [Marmoricola endophyticus]GGF52415.1 hypothetical protein GCM10011519_27980 [Marmoricola endophyticus]
MTGREELPLDSDVEVEESANRLRPVHLRLRFVLLVALGGVLGTAGREGLALLLPTTHVPWATFTVNLVGAFVLGALLEALLRRGEDHAHRRAIRLSVGTGVLGGFTTYSSLATDTVLLRDDPGTALAYALGTVVLGVLATAAGVAVASLVPEGER